jgi:hypothetical protein
MINVNFFVYLLCICMYNVHILNLEIDISNLILIFELWKLFCKFKKYIWIWKLIFQFQNLLCELKNCYMKLKNKISILNLVMHIPKLLFKFESSYFNHDFLKLNLIFKISIIIFLIWVSKLMYFNSKKT